MLVPSRYLGAFLLVVGVFVDFAEPVMWKPVIRYDVGPALKEYLSEYYSEGTAVAETARALDALQKLSPERLRLAILSSDSDLLKYLLKLIEEGLPISAPCLNDVLVFFRDSLALPVNLARLDTCLAENGPSVNCSCLAGDPQAPGLQLAKDEWVLKVLDAFGKIPSGIMQGNFYFIGNYETCVNISLVKSPYQVERSARLWEGKYCRVDLPLNSSYTTVPNTCQNPANQSDYIHYCSQAIKPKYGLCVPRTCTQYDIEQIIDLALRMIGAENTFCSPQVSCHEELEFGRDSSAIWMLTFVCFVLGLMIIGSLYDLNVYRRNVRELPSTSKETDYFKEQPMLVRVLMAFSIPKNAAKILDTSRKPGQIECIHGIRFISLTWVILGHSFYWAIPQLGK